MTPTARSTKWLRDRGWIVARVEQRLHMPKSPFPITRDAFGFGDLLAAHEAHGVFLIQVTSTAHMLDRINKIIMEPETEDEQDLRPIAMTWLKSGGRIWIQGWAKRGPRGQRKKWESRVKEIGGTSLGKDKSGFVVDEVLTL